MLYKHVNRVEYNLVIYPRLHVSGIKTNDLLLNVKIRNEFYSDTQGVLLVYDVTLRSSFEALESWMDEIKRELGNTSDMEDIIFVVCANKVSAVTRHGRFGWGVFRVQPQ